MREFTIRISNPDGKKLNFGRRTLGDVGKEITAVKVALGAIVSAKPGRKPRSYRSKWLARLFNRSRAGP